MKIMRIIFTLILVGILGAALLYLGRNPDAIAPFLNGMLMIVMPLLLGAFLAKRFKTDWRLFGIGAVTFIGAQVLHIPFNTFVLSPALQKLGLETTPGSTGLLTLAFFYGLSAGVFEETARYLGYKRFQEEEKSWEGALMFGAGHGGTEAMILGAIVFYTFLQAILLRGGDLVTLVPPEQIESTRAFLETYFTQPWYMSILGAAERVFAILFHLVGSLLVLRTVRERNIIWYLLSVLWHTGINMIGVYGLSTWGALPVEGVLALTGLLNLGLIFILRPKAVPIKATPPAAPPPAPPTIKKEVTSDDLEKSRYD